MAFYRASASGAIESGRMFFKNVAGNTTQTYQVVKSGNYKLFLNLVNATTNSWTVTVRKNEAVIKTVSGAGSAFNMTDGGVIDVNLTVGDVVSIQNTGATNLGYFVPFAMV